MVVTRYGTCPGVRTGENEVQAWQRQVEFYGPQRVHRVFCPGTLLGTENGSANRARELILQLIPVTEDIVVSCKDVGSEFPARVSELKQRRITHAVALGVTPGKTWIIIHHEPEGDLTVAAYNAKWNTAAPTLGAEQAWLWPGTCHTAFWSRAVNADGVRTNNWRVWIPSNPVVQGLLRFVSVDLYPSAGRPTKAKPKYYEPPGDHTSPYGSWTDIGFCGILDEMMSELRGPAWPNIRPDLDGAIAEINHERPTSANGWPTGFADSDPDGEDNTMWIDDVMDHAHGRYAFVTWFCKGGGDLMARTPQTEADQFRSWIRDTYDNEEPSVEEPDLNHVQYLLGYQAGHAARQSEVDDLTALIQDAEAAIVQLQQDVNAAKAAGRLEAFGEVVNWATTQT